jgi:hypothetical protein
MHPYAKGLALGLALVLAAPAVDAGTLRRSVRTDSGNWTNLPIDQCPGVSLDEPGFDLGGWRMSMNLDAEAAAAVLANAQCQLSQPTALTPDGYPFLDEPELRELLGLWDEGGTTTVEGIRYTFRDAEFEGFQFATYRFPSGLVLVGLHLSPNFWPAEPLFRVANLPDYPLPGIDILFPDYYGEYHCFELRGDPAAPDTARYRQNTLLSEGEVDGPSACGGILSRIRRSGFEAPPDFFDIPVPHPH